jgi:hypothetical protein
VSHNAGVTATQVELDPDGGLTHVYTPRGTARQVIECRDAEVLVSGPAGTGKSRGCLEKLLLGALLNPKFRGLIVRKTGVSLTSTTLQTWKEHVAREALAGGLCVYYGGSRSEPAQYRFSNGARIMITGMDNPTKIMSSEFDIVYVGEATELTPRDWEFITTRLRNAGISFQQIIADCNPDRPTHWLKTRCDEGKTTILYSAHWENPRYYEELPDHVVPVVPDYVPASMVDCAVEEHDGKRYLITPHGVDYLGKLDQLTGVRKDRLRWGKWVAAEGLVYEQWNPKDHVVPRDKLVKIPLEWPRYWVVDFGFTNPFVLQWWAQDPDGRLILYREIYRTKRLVEDHARFALKKVTKLAHGLTKQQRETCNTDPAKAIEHGWRVWTEPKPQAIICDHDAEDRATLTKHLGMGTRAARKAVTRGIQAVESRLKIQRDGRPRLYLLAGALVDRDEELRTAGKPVCTEDEFGSYVWPDGKPGKSDDEHPVKEHDHGMDCVRYLVADRDLGLVIRDRDIWL